MIKIIALDLDGTLLNEEKNISEETLKELRRVQKLGVKIVINTGRNYSGAVASIGRYNLGCDYLVSSGAEYRDADGKLIKSIEMNRAEFAEIYSIISEYGLAARFCTAENDYIVGSSDNVADILKKEVEMFFTKDFDTFSKSELFKTYLEHTIPVESIDKLIDMKIPIYKIFTSDNNIEALDNINHRIAKFTDVVSASSYRTNIELTHIDAQKGIALEHYAKENNCTNDEVMAFGDSMNDYSMLSMDFGYTVAMENAEETIKTVSKYTTLSNENDGVAFMLKKYIK